MGLRPLTTGCAPLCRIVGVPQDKPYEVSPSPGILGWLRLCKQLYFCQHFYTTTLIGLQSHTTKRSRLAEVQAKIRPTCTGNIPIKNDHQISAYPYKRYFNAKCVNTTLLFLPHRFSKHHRQDFTEKSHIPTVQRAKKCSKHLNYC